MYFKKIGRISGGDRAVGRRHICTVLPWLSSSLSGPGNSSGDGCRRDIPPGPFARYIVSAVGALPDGNGALFEYFPGFHILQQFRYRSSWCFSISATMRSLGQRRKAFFFGLLGKGLVHIRPLVILAFRGVDQVFGGGALPPQQLKPHLGVLLLVVGRLLEDGGDLLVALLFGSLAQKVYLFLASLSPANAARRLLSVLEPFNSMVSSPFYMVWQVAATSIIAGFPVSARNIRNSCLCFLRWFSLTILRLDNGYRIVTNCIYLSNFVFKLQPIGGTYL